MSLQGITLRERSQFQTPHDSIYITAEETNYRSGEQICCYQQLETGQGVGVGGNVNWREVGIVIKEQYEGLWW